MVDVKKIETHLLQHPQKKQAPFLYPLDSLQKFNNCSAPPINFLEKTFRPPSPPSFKKEKTQTAKHSVVPRAF